MSAAKRASQGRSGGSSRLSKQARKNAASRRAASGRASVPAPTFASEPAGTSDARVAVASAAAPTGSSNAHPTLDFRPVLDYFSQRGADLDSAFQQFLCEVDPTDAAQQDATARHGMSRAFAEWFVFDHRLVNDRTPLEHFCVAAPMKTDRSLLELFRQVAATQFFSLFRVRSINADACTVTLEDIVDGAAYGVYDGKLGASLVTPGGLMAVRLAQAAGEWRCPCEVALYRDGESAERLAAAAARLAQTGRPLDLLDIVHLIYGVASDGAGPMAALGENTPLEPAPFAPVDFSAPAVFAPAGSKPGSSSSPALGAGQPGFAPFAPMNSSAAGRGFTPRPTDPHVTADAGSPGIEVPPERRAAYLDELQRDYARLAEEHSLTVSWDDIAAAIKSHDGDSVAHDVAEQLFGADASALSRLDDAAFGDLMGIFLGAWNLLPHNYLNGKSPAEIYQSRSH